MKIQIKNKQEKVKYCFEEQMNVDSVHSLKVDLF